MLTDKQHSCLQFLIFVNIFVLTSAITFKYGVHIPNGLSAVNYIYGPDGTWKNLSFLNYEWNYYEQWATPTHPFNKSQLISAANGSVFYTARDANGYLLCDHDRDLELDPGYCGWAFHEHSGKGHGGESRGNPFTQFWLDDNWLARVMSRAYNRPNPDGLTEQNSFMRWRIMSGDPSYWILYNSTHFDTFALDGLYFLATENVELALEKWEMSLSLSEAVFNELNQEFDYPGIHENYHMGLWSVLTEFILGEDIPPEKRTELIQHSVSLRFNIMKNQEKDENGRFIGWTSNIGIGNSLINSESISCGVLGLGANAVTVYEASQSPMQVDPNKNYFIRNSSIVSAVLGISEIGILSEGPSTVLNPGQYLIEFVLRPNRATGMEGIARIDVYDLTSKRVLSERTLDMKDFESCDDLWSRVSIGVMIVESQHFVDFRTHWLGKSDLDISSVRIKDRVPLSTMLSFVSARTSQNWNF